VAWNPAVFSYQFGRPDERNDEDSAPYVPRSVVTNLDSREQADASFWPDDSAIPDAFPLVTGFCLGSCRACLNELT
jgi:hypothetical protein